MSFSKNVAILAATSALALNMNCAIAATPVLVVGALSAHDASAAGTRCAVAYGKVVDVDQCNSATLPDFGVRVTGFTHPTPGIALTCRNYEAAAGADTAAFKQCSTGELDGRAVFALGTKKFTVVFDVFSGCAKLPAGSFAPTVRGHVFFAGEPDARTLDRFQREHDEREQACFARKR